MAALSFRSLLPVVVSLAVAISQAYQSSRVRLATALRLLVQRDQALSEVELLGIPNSLDIRRLRCRGDPRLPVIQIVRRAASKLSHRTTMCLSKNQRSSCAPKRRQMAEHHANSPL